MYLESLSSQINRFFNKVRHSDVHTLNYFELFNSPIAILQFDDAILKFNNNTADHPKRKVFMYPVSIPYAVQKYTSFSLVYLIEINNVADICKYIPTGQTTRSDVLFVLLAMSLCKFRLWNILLPVLYAACVMSPMFSYQDKEMTGTLISQTNPQGTTLNSVNCYLNVCFCLNP